MDTQVPETAAAPKRKRRRVYFVMRIVRMAAVILCILLLAQLFLLPLVVRRQVKTSLEALGLTDVRFVVQHASIWGAEISDLSAGEEGRARVGRVIVAYSPWEVICGRLDSIVIGGA